MVAKKALDGIIVFLTFMLLTFHILTYAQAVYSFPVTLIVFAFIVGLSLLRNEGFVGIREHPGFLFLIFMCIIMVLLMVYVKNDSVTKSLGMYLPYIIWPILYFIIKPILDKGGKKAFLLLCLAVFVVGVIATFIVVRENNDVARLLAGMATEEERNEYYRQGVGGYGFIYGAVFVLFGIIMWFQKEENMLLKFLLIAAALITVAMIVYASYTIALFLTLIVISISFYSRSRGDAATVYFILTFIAVLLFITPILNIIYNWARDMDLAWFEKRIKQFLDAESEGGAGISSLSRPELYMNSLKTFFDNIFIGVKDVGRGRDIVGGHSMVFDLLATTGLFGMTFCFAFFRFINSMRNFALPRSRFIYFLFILLMFINTVDTIVMFPMVLFVLPLLLDYVGVTETKPPLYPKNGSEAK